MRDARNIKKLIENIRKRPLEKKSVENMMVTLKHMQAKHVLMT